jgi:hypothetical protein
MLILILMVLCVVTPLLALIVSEVSDAKWNRQYDADMDRRYEAKRAARQRAVTRTAPR